MYKLLLSNGPPCPGWHPCHCGGTSGADSSCLRLVRKCLVDPGVPVRIGTEGTLSQGYSGGGVRAPPPPPPPPPPSMCFFLSVREKISNSNADQKISRFPNFRVPWIMVSNFCTGPSITALFLRAHTSQPQTEAPSGRKPSKMSPIRPHASAHTPSPGFSFVSRGLRQATTNTSTDRFPSACFMNVALAGDTSVGNNSSSSLCERLRLPGEGGRAGGARPLCVCPLFTGVVGLAVVPSDSWSDVSSVLGHFWSSGFRKGFPLG